MCQSQIVYWCEWQWLWSCGFFSHFLMGSHSANPFCQGLLYDVTFGFMPNCRLRNPFTLSEKILSRSKMRYFGAWSNGKASRSCWITQSAQGWLVTLKWVIFLRLRSIMKNTNRMLKLTVGTIKKSIAEITSRWFLKNVIHDCCFF